MPNQPSPVRGDDIGLAISRRDVLKLGTLGTCALSGFGGLPLMTGCSEPAGQQHTDVPTIVLVSLDTTRADHLGCYGYDRPTSPNIDKFAKESMVYERMIATSTWTLPSHASLFTGKFTCSHGARHDPNGSLCIGDGFSQRMDWMNALRLRTIAQDETTLAMLLGDAGYATAGIVGGIYMKRVFGLGKGFDHYDDNNISTINGRVAENVTDDALAWLRQTKGEPQFLFLNYFDAHGPFMPPEEFAVQFEPRGIRFSGGPTEGVQAYAGSREARIALYDAEILYMDYHVGRLLEGMKKLGLYEDAWIIFTADHGELHGEHGGKFGHGNWPFREVVNIPMIVKEPGANPAQGRTDEWIQLTDVLPMILDRLNIDMPENIQGDVPPTMSHPILIESKVLPPFEQDGHWLSIINRDGMKYIWNSKGDHMLFDTQKDPQELVNLFGRQQAMGNRMRDEMVDYMAGLPQPGTQQPERQVDQDSIRVLKSLGYLQ